MDLVTGELTAAQTTGLNHISNLYFDGLTLFYALASGAGYDLYAVPEAPINGITGAVKVSGGSPVAAGADGFTPTFITGDGEYVYMVLRNVNAVMRFGPDNLTTAPTQFSISTALPYKAAFDGMDLWVSSTTNNNLPESIPSRARPSGRARARSRAAPHSCTTSVGTAPTFGRVTRNARARAGRTASRGTTPIINGMLRARTRALLKCSATSPGSGIRTGSSRDRRARAQWSTSSSSEATSVTDHPRCGRSTPSLTLTDAHRSSVSTRALTCSSRATIDPWRRTPRRRRRPRPSRRRERRGASDARRPHREPGFAVDQTSRGRRRPAQGECARAPA